MGATLLFFSPSGTSFTGSAGGTEPPNAVTRRIISLLDGQYARLAFMDGAADGTQLRIEASVDNGATWVTLVPNSPVAVANQPVVSDWSAFPSSAKNDKALVRIMVVNAAIATTVFMVELQWR